MDLVVEVRVLPPQLDVKRIGKLARLEVNPEIVEDFKEILKFMSVLDEVPEVAPLFSVREGFTPMREDEAGETYPDIYALAPDTEGRFVRFLSPIGRKT